MNKLQLLEYVCSLNSLGWDVSQYLWKNPQLAGEERLSVEVFKNVLRENEFKIHEVKNVNYAFYAEYGSGHPVIGVLGEYDALAGLSQEVCAEKKPVKEGGAGQGCGHNLLGTACLLASLGAKKLIASNRLKGTVRFYGCPAEETLQGKVLMIKNGAFENCDVALTWHPDSINANYSGGFVALDSMKFEFNGRASHAATAPQTGRSALDAVELMNVGANYLREHIVDGAKIHYNVHGDEYPPNVVPPYAWAWYFVRAPKRGQVADITRRLIMVARGAAMMTETEMKVKRVSGCHELNLTPKLVKLCEENMELVPLPEYTSDELTFAKKLQETVEKERLNTDMEITGSKLMANKILKASKMGNKASAGSTDAGDVSMIMPMQFFNVACWPLGCALHSWQTTSAAGSTLGHKGMMYAAQVLSGIMFDLYSSEELFGQVVESFNEVKKEYICPLDQPMK